jgi:ATP-dependent DNA helicase RecG
MTSPIPTIESLTVEFKSDRKRLPDLELIGAVVCMANAEGASCGLEWRMTARPRVCTPTT